MQAALGGISGRMAEVSSDLARCTLLSQVNPETPELLVAVTGFLEVLSVSVLALLASHSS